MNLTELNLSIRDINAIHRTGCKSVEELKQRISDDMDGTKRQLGYATFDRIEDALAQLPAETSAAVDIVADNVVVSPEYVRAMELHQLIMSDKQIIENGLYRMGQHLKEMRDGKLYKQHGYANFDDYCQNAVGFSRRQAYHYIGITENLSQDFVETSAQIGVKKLSILAKLDDETRETVTESVDVQTVTAKELQAKIAALTAERDKKEQQIQYMKESRNRDLSRISAEKCEISENLRKKSAEVVKAQNRIMELEKQIKALEERPVEVAVSEDEAREIERLRSELSATQALLSDADAAASKAAEAVRREYEQKLANAQKPERDQKSIDSARYESLKTMFEHVVDELENFLEDLDDDPRIEYVKKIDKYYENNLLYLREKGAGA